LSSRETTSKLKAHDERIAKNDTRIANNKASIKSVEEKMEVVREASFDNKVAIASLEQNIKTYQQETNVQMLYMKEEYSTGIASAIAIGQISTAADGFSVGVGHGSFNGANEMALGLGYGNTFQNGTRFQMSAAKNNLATGVGFTLSF